MAPSKRLRTYSRGNNSTISSVTAFNILFAKNLTERKLHGKVRKGKNKVQVKELPKKIKTHVKTMLSDESSLRVNLDDTFDKIFKNPQHINGFTKDVSVKIIANNTSTSVIRHFSKINSFSPMVCKLRSFKSKSQNLEVTNSISWFQHLTPPGERITNELETEKMGKNKKSPKKSSRKASKEQNSFRDSPILLRSRVNGPEIIVTDSSNIKNKSMSTEHGGHNSGHNKNNTQPSFIDPNCSFNPIFTNSVREKILVHSSTPYISNKASRLVKQPISPIKTIEDEIESCINESFEEIRSWEAAYPDIKPNNSLADLSDCAGFKKDINQIDINKDKFVTVRTRPINKLTESEQRRNNADNKSFNLEDFELFYNQFKTRSFKLEDFEKFYNQLNSASGTIERFNGKRSQNQVDQYNSVSLKDFENFFVACQSKILENQESFLGNSHRNNNYVTNRKHRFNRKSSNISKKYLKQFDLKDLVVVLDDNLVNNAKAKLKGRRSLCQAAVMNSIIKRQPVVKLTRLSVNALSSLRSSFKAKDRLNGFKACRKFSSNWMPRKRTRSNSKEQSTNSLISNINSMTNSQYFDLGQLFINLTRIPIDFGSSGSKITEVETDGITKRKERSSGKNSRTNSNSYKERRSKSSSKLDKENEKSKKEMSSKAILNKKQSNASNRSQSLSSSSSRSMELPNPTAKKSLSARNTKSCVNSEPDSYEDIHTDDQRTRIQLFMHSESYQEVTKKKTDGKKEYVAKILVGSVSDTEVDLRNSSNSLLRRISKSMMSYSQESVFNHPKHGFSLEKSPYKNKSSKQLQSISDIFKDSSNFSHNNESRVCCSHESNFSASANYSPVSKSSRVLRSRCSNVSDSQNTSQNNDYSLHNPSHKELTQAINSRLSCHHNTDCSISYSSQDISGSILATSKKNSISDITPKIKDMVVNLTLHSWDNQYESFDKTTTRVSRSSSRKSYESKKHSSINKYMQTNRSSTPEVDRSSGRSQREEQTLLSAKKKSVQFDLRSSGKSNDSDVIESSITTPNIDCFKAPMTFSFYNRKPKKVNLKAGKSWRRSLLVHKRSSFIDLTQDSDEGTICSTSSTHKNLILPQNTSVRRQSMKIVPLCDSRLSRRRTALQTYAQTNLSIVLDNSSSDIDLTPIKSKLLLEKSLPIVTAENIVLKRCGQTEPLPFEKLYPKSLLKDCKKIGEGVYGEVFLYSNPNGDTTVMKVIPIEGDKIVNGERQKKFDEILTEIVIASELSNLRENGTNQTSAFAEVQRICCVRGKYPKTLLDLWDTYDKDKGSENDSPTVFEKDQLYIVLDLANAGTDLEAFVFNSAAQAACMFKQVACALAVAEEHLQFEHRDLHWGNVLLKSVDKNKKVTCKHKGKFIESQTQGVEVTVIDFTLSRIAHDGVVIFNDLGQDPDLFVAEGDYQFDIYRLMKEKNSNNWQKFEPYTNVLWLHYILKKSITALRYKNVKTKVHKKNIDCLKKYETDLLTFKSASDFVNEYF